MWFESYRGLKFANNSDFKTVFRSITGHASRRDWSIPIRLDRVLRRVGSSQIVRHRIITYPFVNVLSYPSDPDPTVTNTLAKVWRRSSAARGGDGRSVAALVK